MAAYIKGVMYMKYGHKLGEGGVKGVLMSTHALREIGELVRKTHHIDPLTERNDRANSVIKLITLKNKKNNHNHLPTDILTN